MAGLHGRQPGAGVRSLFVFSEGNSLTVGDTSISGADDNGKTLAYADGKYTDVIRNGGLITPTQYTANDGTSITGLKAVESGDVFLIFAYDVFAIANHYTKDEVDNDFIQKMGKGTDPGLGFNTWRVPNSSEPTWVQAQVEVQTDGTTNGLIRVEVDESGGTTKDYEYQAYADNNLSSYAIVKQIISIYIPAGAAYQFNNVADPNANNAVTNHREFTG